MVAKFTEFTLNGESFKAYHTLDNLFRIENSGINLTELGVMAVDAPPSFTQTRDIMQIALKADIPDTKERLDFVHDYIDKERFKACNKVREFILSALTAPSSEDGEDEKKIVAG